MRKKREQNISDPNGRTVAIRRKDIDFAWQFPEFSRNAFQTAAAASAQPINPGLLVPPES
ncbi:hypothetical protein MZK49_05490 [Ensifer sesbaniae]|jgi:hypothetical protein|uniref:hypothetical protein n=1 Tax=Ensifer sesbaniae TaxID=1214071 RepID=UPI002001C945|nr:hypothetical protein [Ensifer sesbaniae]